MDGGKRFGASALSDDTSRACYRRDFSFFWLSTLTLTSLGSIFALGSAIVVRDDDRVSAPRVVTVMIPVRPDAADLVAIAATSEPGNAIALATPDAAAAVDGSGGSAVSPSSLASDISRAVDPGGTTDPVATEKNALVHVRLSLFAATEAAVDDERSSNTLLVSALDGASTVPTVPMSPLYRPDLDRLVSLSAVDFPFSRVSYSNAYDSRENAVMPASVTSPATGASAALARAIDPSRFGGSDAAMGYAPTGMVRDSQAFERFDLADASPSWRRLADREAGAATQMRSRGVMALDLGREESGSTSFVSQTDDGDSSRDVDGTSFGEATGTFVSASVDAASDGMEAEEAFFAKTDGSVTTTIYDAVERAARERGLLPEMSTQLLTLLSAEFDFDQSVAPSDRLDVFFTGAGENDAATTESEFYFIRATFGGAYRAFYRFQSDDGTVAYVGPEGRSAEQGMLRNPVASAKFQSGFGMRRHPILGYERMHKGVDWSAPKGTPIVATASGTIERAGSDGGYGLRTVISHDSGYTTSYSHQSRLADGVVEGASVRKGEVIGFVGSTGLATGSHIHYEVARDGEAIDPMQLPASDGPMLTGERLDAFLAERDRIDALAYSEDDAVLSLAAAGN